MKKKKAGVVIAGCGYLDGAEIQEVVLTLLYLDQLGVDVLCMAPDIPQAHVVNHLTGEETGETRNVLVEAARIARGNVVDVASVNASDIDVLILPGGYGVAKNLCTFAFDGPEMKVNPAVEKLVREVHEAGKPVGAWCIAPALMAKLFPGLSLTIGDDAATAFALESMGAKHAVCSVGNIVVDRTKRVVTTPAYMLGPWIANIAEGIERGVHEVIAMTQGQPLNIK